MVAVCVFFFQAEDGIRDSSVTGVQTCALPIFSTSMDLERSFSPVYARGLLHRGHSSVALLGVNQQETQASVDAALTFGLLWLEACREREAGRSVVEGLRLFVPARRSATLQIRLAHLNHEIAKLQIVELEERDETVAAFDHAHLS